jgi:hypothetical protein
MNIKYWLMVGLLALLPCSTQASLVDEGALNLPNLGSPEAEKAYLESLGVFSDLTYLQKWNTDGTGFALTTTGIGTYTFSPDGNVATMDITWDLTGTAYDLAYVLVKDGNAPDGPNGEKLKWYHRYSVTADQVKNSLTPQAITINNDKGISHISFFGVTDGGSVPEPATALVWSLLIGMGVAYRRYR